MVKNPFISVKENASRKICEQIKRPCAGAESFEAFPAQETEVVVNKVTTLSCKKPEGRAVVNGNRPPTTRCKR